MLSKIWVWDTGSGKTHSGSRIQGSKRHRSPDPGSATLLQMIQRVWRYRAASYIRSYGAMRLGGRCAERDGWCEDELL